MKFRKKSRTGRKAKNLGSLLFRSFRKRYQPKPRTPLAPIRLSLSQLQLNATKKRKKKGGAAPSAPEVITSPSSVPLPSTLPAPSSTLALAAAPVGEKSLFVHEFLKPGDRLRQSIEAFLLDQRSPHTRRAYGKDLKRFVKFLHSKSEDAKNQPNKNGGLENLNRTIVIAYKESLLSEGLEHTTVDRHLATLRSFFKWLVDDGILEKSPAEGVRFLNPKRLSPTKGFSDEEVKKLLSLPNLHTRTGSLHYAVLMILFYCGLRRSEVCDLRTSNLGMERNQRTVRLRGKGNAERMIVIIPAVWSALRHYFLITGRDMSVDAPLFVPQRNNRTGIVRKSLDPSMIFYIVTRYAKLSGITNRVSPHSCRATAISNARDHHVPDRAIQEFAGWASPDMITRYDKRKNSVENSASKAITYGAENRSLPIIQPQPSSSTSYTGSTEEVREQPAPLK